MRKLKWVFMGLILCIMLSFVSVNAYQIKQSSDYRINSSQISLTSHMLAQPLDQTEISSNYDPLDLEQRQFELITTSPNYLLYLNKALFNIAVVDLNSNYVWYGYYPNYKEKGYTKSVSSLIESGITIEYFDAQTLNEARMSLSNPDAGTLIAYTLIQDGIRAEINLSKMGISFAVEISLVEDQVFVKIPHEDLVEVPYQTAAMRFPREFKVHSIYVFPYLGSNNHHINGYAMIPDGSGALIRYEDVPFQTAFIKRIYARDIGIQTQPTTMSHLKPESAITMPIYGINHGYEHSAFLAQIHSGMGAAELHSYPFMYNNVDLNTTFFVYKTRDRSLIRLSGGQISTIPIINKDPYPFDFLMSYTFLSDSNASYTGMALAYKSALNLEQTIKPQPISLHLEAVGIDYKPTLLGQRAVKLTTYHQLSQIIKTLTRDDDLSLHITYRSFNQGGLFSKNDLSIKPSRQLGGKKDFSSLINEVHQNDQVDMALYLDPLLASHQKAFQSVLRRTTLDLFTPQIESSRIEHGYYLPVGQIASSILSQKNALNTYQITDLSLGSIGQHHFSYQISRQTVYREQMIMEIQEQLEKLSSINLGLYQPADYTWKHLSHFFGMHHQSNLYGFMTDSIPLVSIVLSGHVNLYTGYLNYINDLNLMKLRMIEYGLQPSFIITYLAGHHLRYTHHEYLFTTQFDVFKDDMKAIYQDVSAYLNLVNGHPIIHHEYIDHGIVKVTYSHQKMIIINYTQNDYVYDNHIILSMDALLLEVS